MKCKTKKVTKLPQLMCLNVWRDDKYVMATFCVKLA